MSSIILNIVIILGIIIAGGFLIFFLGDLLLSILDPKNDEEKINSKRKKEIRRFKKKMKNIDPEIVQQTEKDPRVAAILTLETETVEEEKTEEPEQTIEVLENGAVVEAYNPNAAEEEVKEEPAEEEEAAAEEETAEEEEQSEEDRLAEARAALERRKLEILRRMQESAMEEETEEESTEEETSEETVEETETAEAPAAEEVEEDNVVVEEEEVQEEEITGPADDEEVAAARAELEAEKRRYAAMIAALQANKSENNNTINRQEYEERLLKKEEELRENEKDFKLCKKEYLPLSKVAKTLEKDEKKLRIKEAQVAKQKVILYGVNNYADIDSEKAKKLAEDLDLLDGLKLSVQHCREVMEQNKDRLPILERMYNVLKAQNESLKNDIAYLQETLNRFDSEN